MYPLPPPSTGYNMHLRNHFLDHHNLPQMVMRVFNNAVQIPVVVAVFRIGKILPQFIRW